jgi:predicted MPP superfamily phosphohydrolase
MMLRLHHVITLIEQTFWLHVWGHAGAESRDILALGVGFALSALLWAILSRRARVIPLIVGTGALLYLADWGMLQLLPWVEVSHSPVSSGLWFILLGRGMALVGANALALVGLGLARLLRGRWDWRWGSWVVLAGQLLTSVLFLDAWLIEPLSVSVSRLDISSPKLSGDAPPIRIVQLSDIHIVTYGPRERQVAARVKQLQPDLILLTGDYFNALGTQPRAALREMLEDLEAPYGIYATTGNVDLPPTIMMDMFGPTGARILDNQAVDIEIHGQQIHLVGLSAHGSVLSGLHEMEKLQDQGADRFRMLLFHYPDFIRLAPEAHIDLYLSGHTHGGQARVPFYGALHINSLWENDYEMGRYDVEDTVLFVSRGIGFSGGYEPQVRFRCPPEVVLITLRGR